MSSIDRRIISLTDALRRRQIERATPVDGLSQSLFDFQRELAALGKQGKAILLEELNRPSEDDTTGLNIEMEDVEEWIKASIVG